MTCEVYALNVVHLLTAGSKAWANSLNWAKVGPTLTSLSGQFKRTLRIACVAQALFIT